MAVLHCNAVGSMDRRKGAGGVWPIHSPLPDGGCVLALFATPEPEPGGALLGIAAKALMEAVGQLRETGHKGRHEDPFELLDSLSRKLQAATGAAPVRPGPSAALALVWQEQLSVAHIGNCRAFLYREGRLLALTRNHTEAEEAVDRTEITAKESRQHPGYRRLTRWLGAAEAQGRPELRAVSIPLRPGDNILLLADDLCGYLDEGEIAAGLQEDQSPDELFLHFSERAEARAGKPVNAAGVIGEIVGGIGERPGPARAPDKRKKPLHVEPTPRMGDPGASPVVSLLPTPTGPLPIGPEEALEMVEVEVEVEAIAEAPSAASPAPLDPTPPFDGCSVGLSRPETAGAEAPSPQEDEAQTPPDKQETRPQFEEQPRPTPPAHPATQPELDQQPQPTPPAHPATQPDLEQPQPTPPAHPATQPEFDQQPQPTPPAHPATQPQFEQQPQPAPPEPPASEPPPEPQPRPAPPEQAAATEPQLLPALMPAPEEEDEELAFDDPRRQLAALQNQRRLLLVIGALVVVLLVLLAWFLLSSVGTEPTGAAGQGGAQQARPAASPPAPAGGQPGSQELRPAPVAGAPAASPAASPLQSMANRAESGVPGTQDEPVRAAAESSVSAKTEPSAQDGEEEETGEAQQGGEEGALRGCGPRISSLYEAAIKTPEQCRQVRQDKDALEKECKNGASAERFKQLVDRIGARCRESFVVRCQKDTDEIREGIKKLKSSVNRADFQRGFLCDGLLRDVAQAENARTGSCSEVELTSQDQRATTALEGFRGLALEARRLCKREGGSDAN